MRIDGKAGFVRWLLLERWVYGASALASIAAVVVGLSSQSQDPWDYTRNTLVLYLFAVSGFAVLGYRLLAIPPLDTGPVRGRTPGFARMLLLVCALGTPTLAYSVSASFGALRMTAGTLDEHQSAQEALNDYRDRLDRNFDILIGGEAWEALVAAHDASMEATLGPEGIELYREIVEREIARHRVEMEARAVSFNTLYAAVEPLRGGTADDALADFLDNARTEFEGYRQSFERVAAAAKTELFAKTSEDTKLADVSVRETYLTTILLGPLRQVLVARVIERAYAARRLMTLQSPEVFEPEFGFSSPDLLVWVFMNWVIVAIMAGFTALSLLALYEFPAKIQTGYTLVLTHAVPFLGHCMSFIWSSWTYRPLLRSELSFGSYAALYTWTDGTWLAIVGILVVVVIHAVIYLIPTIVMPALRREFRQTATIVAVALAGQYGFFILFLTESQAGRYAPLPFEILVAAAGLALSFWTYTALRRRLANAGIRQGTLLARLPSLSPVIDVVQDRVETWTARRLARRSYAATLLLEPWSYAIAAGLCVLAALFQIVVSSTGRANNPFWVDIVCFFALAQYAVWLIRVTMIPTTGTIEDRRALPPAWRFLPLCLAITLPPIAYTWAGIGWVEWQSRCMTTEQKYDAAVAFVNYRTALNSNRLTFDPEQSWRWRDYTARAESAGLGQLDATGAVILASDIEAWRPVFADAVEEIREVGGTARRSLAAALGPCGARLAERFERAHEAGLEHLDGFPDRVADARAVGVQLSTVSKPTEVGPFPEVDGVGGEIARTLAVHRMLRGETDVAEATQVHEIKFATQRAWMWIAIVGLTTALVFPIVARTRYRADAIVGLAMLLFLAYLLLRNGGPISDEAASSAENGLGAAFQIIFAPIRLLKTGWFDYVFQYFWMFMFILPGAIQFWRWRADTRTLSLLTLNMYFWILAYSFDWMLTRPEPARLAIVAVFAMITSALIQRFVTWERARPT